jgi:hypothetical protein
MLPVVSINVLGGLQDKQDYDFKAKRIWAHQVSYPRFGQAISHPVFMPAWGVFSYVLRL